jgi:hypothetical protein
VGLDVGLAAFAAGAIAQWLWLKARAKEPLAALSAPAATVR